MKRSTQHAFEPEEVMAYLDGELDAHQASALASHLEHCGECRALAAQLTQVSERMLDLQVGPCPAQVSEKILKASVAAEHAQSATDQAPRKPKPRRALKILAWSFASLLVLVVIAAVSIANLSRSKKAYQAEMATGLSAPQENLPLANRKVGSLLKLQPGIAGDGGGGGGGEDYAFVAPKIEGLNTAAPAPPPQPTGNFQAGVGVGSGSGAGRGSNTPEIQGPMIVQTAAITILANNYDQSSAALQPLTSARGGYVQDMTADTRTGEARSVSATLRVPEKQLDPFLGDLRKLGHVERENRSNQEITDQYIDLTARLKAARATEQRILQLLATRTGKLSDVLEAEQELERVRGEIESMDGQRVHMEHEVSYATVKVQLNEEYRAELNGGAVSTGRQIRNSAVEGFRNVKDGAVALVLFGLAYGPSILFWLALLGVPAWFAWRWHRRRGAEKAA